MNAAKRSVLITGCSSGIGRATALRLARAGFATYASARDVGALGELRDAGCHTLPLDVRDEASMAAAIAEITRERGALYALVNNAGFSQSGALETLSLEKVRRQFETNVFGLLRLTQLALPGMRAAGAGRIINLSSMGGKITVPGFGAYHASKFALEALSDVLRFEVAPAGIEVVVIQPGAIRTGFGEAALQNMAPEADGRDPYAAFNAAVAAATKAGYEKGLLALLSGEADDVARVVERAILARRPRTRYRVTASARVMMFQRAIFSDRLWDAMMRGQFREMSRALPGAGS